MTTAPRRITEAELHALADGELTEEARAEAEALLAAHPEDDALAREIRSLNEAMRVRYAHRLEEPVPQAIQALLARVPRWPPAIAPRQWALAAALLIAVIAGAAGYLARGLVPVSARPAPSFVANALGAHNVYLPEVRHPVEVKAEEEHLIRWLTRRVGAPIRAPSLADRGWRLMGGRLLPDLGHPAAQFMYEDAGGRRLTLYIRKETGMSNTAFRFYEKDGLASFYWIDRPLAYALAGRIAREELTAIADAVYAQLEQK
jgi:anti-sigma factor RsiW